MVLFNRKKIISEKGRKLRSRSLLSSPAPVPFLGDPGQAEHSQVWAHSIPLGHSPDPWAVPSSAVPMGQPGPGLIAFIL